MMNKKKLIRKMCLTNSNRNWKISSFMDNQSHWLLISSVQSYCRSLIDFFTCLIKLQSMIYYHETMRPSKAVPLWNSWPFLNNLIACTSEDLLGKILTPECMHCGFWPLIDTSSSTVNNRGLIREIVIAQIHGNRFLEWSFDTNSW